MIRIAVCDDDAASLNKMSDLIEQYCAESEWKAIQTAFHSPLELLAEIEKGARWDILFLDVIMPGENGINVAKEIRKHDDVIKIIFLTASCEYAVESYAVGAYFYQIKPVSKENLYRLLDGVISQCTKEQQQGMILRGKSGITRIDMNRLEYCEVIGRTLVFHLEDGKVFEGSGSLDELQEKLARYENFLRPHRSFLINMEYIQSISGRSITLASLVEIPIPHGKCSEVKKRYLEYAFSRKQVFI